MTIPQPTFGVPLEVTNPGQFFACCGLLELAHRLWPSVTGWFSAEDSVFYVQAPGGDSCTLKSICETLQLAGVDGELSTAERDELATLERQKRNQKQLSNVDDERRARLGERQREGALQFCAPFGLRLDWWREDGDDIPKTFAGKQEVLRMARAMLSEISGACRDARPLKYRSFLKVAPELSRMDQSSKRKPTESKVEPFYFDADRYSHSLDVGFSLDVQAKSIRATAAPLTELLALTGLQRFRPRLTGNWTFEHFTWHKPLGVVVAAVVTSGTVAMAGSRGYRFCMRFRDDQKRYKAFGFSRPMEVEK